MKKMKKSLAVVLALVMTMSMAMSVGASDSAFDGTLKVGIPGDPADLDPFSTMSVGRMYTLETIYEYLGVWESIDGDFVPWIAKDWTVSDDALTVDVEIWDNVSDSAGNHITADDVKWCYDMAIEANCSIQLGYVDSIDVTGDYTLTFNLNDVIIEGWEGVLSSIPIISQAAYEADPESFSVAPITTSAYVVTDFTPGSSVTLEIRDDYWQTDDSALPVKHNVDAIEFQVIPEDSQMAIGLETGLIDVAVGMATSEVARFMEGGESADGFETFDATGTMVYSLLFNCSDDNGVFCGYDDVRKAIAYAIDVDAILEGVLNDGGIKCMTWGGYESNDFDPEWVDAYYDYDPELAAQMIADSGWTQDAPLRMACTSDSTLSSCLEMIQAYLDAVGIQTELMVVDSGLFDSIKYDDTEWDMLLDTIGGKNMGLLAKSMNSVDKSYLNIVFANDPQLQSLAEQMVAVPTHTEDVCEEWVDYMNDQMYAYGLFNVYSYVAAADFVEDVTFTSRAAIFPGDTVIAG